MTATPGPRDRDRDIEDPAVLSQGFRPFFLASGIWAIVGLVVWLAALSGRLSIPSAFDPYSWHIHEMLFGFVAAALAGFVLTAIPNWTGRLPLQGWPLLALVLLWVAGRVAVALSAPLGAAPAAVIDVSFLAVLAVVAGREIAVGRNWRNLPVILAISLFCLSNVLFHLEVLSGRATAEPGWRLAIGVVAVLIALIGGRIIPSFTGNWLAKRHEPRPPPFDRFDRVTLIATIVALATWAAGVDGPAVAAVTGLAAALNAVRLGRWRGHRTATEPLLWILHVAYAWLAIGLALLAAAEVTPAVTRSAAVHALTMGAMATMILAVSTRAILGHTGRTLHAGPATTIAYGLLTAAALTRVSASLFPEVAGNAVSMAGVLWSAAFLLFLIVYTPMMLRPDPRHQRGPNEPQPGGG